MAQLLRHCCTTSVHQLLPAWWHAFLWLLPLALLGPLGMPLLGPPDLGLPDLVLVLPEEPEEPLELYLLRPPQPIELFGLGRDLGLLHQGRPTQVRDLVELPAAGCVSCAAIPRRLHVPHSPPLLYQRHTRPLRR